MGLLYAVGAQAVLSQVSVAAITRSQLYAVAFFLGVWSALTVVFVSNYVSEWLLDDPVIELRPPRR